MKLPRFVSTLPRLFIGNNCSGSVSSDDPAVLVAEPKVEPPNLDWMLPGSESKKLELVGKQVGEVVYDYLWYYLGNVHSLKQDELAAIEAKFFVGGYARFGDIELHGSSVLPPDKRTVLRLRGRLYFHLSFELRGRYCPLYQVGHSGGLLGTPTHGSVNFHKCWNEIMRVTTAPSSVPS